MTTMTQPTDPDAIREYWEQTIQQMNEGFSDAIEGNIEAQTRFMESWMDAMTELSDETRAEDALDGYRQAYETWMSAAEEALESMADAAEGEDVSVTQFRDIWLNAANESMKELMATNAFAAATGQAVEEALDLRGQTEEVTESTLHDLGMPAKGDIQEVGDRLVELERRQHAVERKLDEILDAIEE